MRVVDVGAKIGYYLLLFEKYIGSEGKVICIEPSVENLPELKKNIEINRFVNVKLFDVAIGMDDGTTGLRVGINSGVVDLPDYGQAGKNQGAYQVPLRKLDSLVTDKIDFLKIDVEGYEGQVLKGAQEILNRDKPILFLEIHPSIIPEFGFSVGQILDDLSSIYKETTCYECQPNENIDFIKKISLRYIDKDPLVKVKNIPQYISKCAEGEITRPFWAICKS
jgi:FkbM family methyltransferase